MSFDDNPFEDGSSTATKNPFDDEGATPTFTSSSNTRNSTLRTAPPPVHIINPQVAVNFDTSNEGMRRKEEELRRREDELKKREKMLDKTEKTIDNGGKKPKNWPFFRPVLYQNITEEILPEQQFLVRAAYYLWIATTMVWALNFGVVLGDLIVTGDSKEIASMILSIIYFVFFVPLFFLIFRLLYNAARKLRSSYYLTYMCLKWFEFVVYIWQIIGVRGWGGGGFFVMVNLFEKKGASYKTMAVISLILTVLWIFIFLCHTYLFLHARIFYKQVGGFAAAKKQGASYAVKTAADNPDVVIAASKGAYSASQV